MASGLLIRAENPPAPTAPPGYKVVYHDMGGGTKVPILVKNQADPLAHAGSIVDDPLDPEKVFSAANPEGNKKFNTGTVSESDKSGLNTQQSFVTKVFDTTTSNSVYNIGSKPTFHTTAYEGSKAAGGFGQSFNTKDASSEWNHASSAFAPTGAPEQNRAAPVDAKTYATFASPDANKDFSGPEADAIHRHATPGEHIDGDLQVIGEIPNRPLSIDEVKNLINHGFKADFSQPAPTPSKALNDPNYQPEPLRIEPTTSDEPPVAPVGGSRKVDTDDSSDPVPSPGTMADPPPENSEPLPSK